MLFQQFGPPLGFQRFQVKLGTVQLIGFFRLLLQGHGVVAVGKNVSDAVIRAVSRASIVHRRDQPYSSGTTVASSFPISARQPHVYAVVPPRDEAATVRATCAALLLFVRFARLARNYGA